MSQSFVILCRKGSTYGGMVIESVLQAGLNIEGVVLQQWGIKQKYRRFRSYVRKHGLVTVVFSKTADYVDSKLMSGSGSTHVEPVEHVLSKYSVPIFRVPTLNGKETLTCLDRLKPDVILLGGVGVVSAKVIERASKGVLNAHAGIVPEYRGSYVVRWALLAGDPIGITVHMVDSGIDTGAVLSITRVNLPKTRSLIAIDKYIDGQRAELLVKESKRILAGGIDPMPQQSHSDHPLYSVMPPGKLLRTYRLVWQSMNH